MTDGLDYCSRQRGIVKLQAHWDGSFCEENVQERSGTMLEKIKEYFLS